jgi:hypothetical protein
MSGSTRGSACLKELRSSNASRITHPGSHGFRDATQQKEIDTLKAELKEQKTLIQKVSAQLELNNAVPRTVLNDQ